MPDPDHIHEWKLASGTMLTCLPPKYPMVCTICWAQSHRVMEDEGEGVKITVRCVPTTEQAVA